jgi:DNA-binding NarL/FixJ family response regulator
MTAADVATVRVLIVDNHELIRASLAIELNQFADLEVVGVAADGEKAIALTQQLQPDVVLMDLRMPVMDGLTASKHIKHSYPNVRIIAYTSMNDPQTEVMAQTVPIDQFCYKDIETEALVDLIRQVAGWHQLGSQSH